MRQSPIALFIAACTVVTMSCYPDQMVNSIEELASVTTLVDSGPPLQSARTFTLVDSIFHPAFRGQGAALIGHQSDTLILARIRRNFVAAGWREVTNVPVVRPDVVILTTVFEETHTGVAYGDWWGGWGYWPGWPAGYGDDWAWGFPGAVEFVYESGTLLITMLDIRNGNPSTRRVPLLWAAGVQGVLVSANQTVDGALRGIDQAFLQSPYLERP